MTRTNRAEASPSSVPVVSGARNRVGLMTPHTVRGLHGRLVESFGISIGTEVRAAGEQIVPEVVAEEFGVSRAVVREALKVIEAKGMVIARPRTGTRVRPCDKWDLLDPDVIRWRSTGPNAQRQLEELLAVRGAIEPLAARSASSGAVPSDIDAMAYALKAMAEAVGNQEMSAFNEADISFHRALLAASGNQIIAQFVDPVEAAMRVRQSMRLEPAVLPIETVTRHQAVLDAIVARDGTRAESASREIVNVAGAEVVQSLIEQRRRTMRDDGGLGPGGAPGGPQ